MFMSKISMNNLSVNKVLTIPYILIMSLFCGFFYVLSNLFYNKSLLEMSQGKILKSILVFGSIIVFLFTLIYGSYANRFLSNERNENMGIFLMLGMGKKSIYQIVFWEKLYLFLSNLFLGLIFGFCYGKLSFLSIKKLVEVESLKEQYSLSAILWTFIMLLSIYLLMYLAEYRELKASSINQIFNSRVKRENTTKTSMLIGILGIICLIYGYYMALTTGNVTTSFRTFILAAFLVVIGILGTFSSGIILLVSQLKKNRVIYYHKKYFVLIAGMLHRLKNNAFSLGLICVLSTLTLVTITVLGSIYIEKDSIINTLSPKDITVLSMQNMEPSLEKIALKNNTRLVEKEQLDISQSVYGNLKNNKLQIDKNGGVTSDYQITIISLASFNRSNDTDYKLGKNEILTYVQNAKHVYKTYLINGEKFRNVKQLAKVKFIFSPQKSIMPNFFIVTNDKKVARKVLREEPQQLKMAGFNIKGTRSQRKNVYQEIAKTNFYAQQANVVGKNRIISLVNTLFGGLLFIGIILGMIFAILTAVVIYYKQLSEGIRDREDYVTMGKLGMRQVDIKKGVNAQITFTFLLPMLFALANLIISMPIIYNIMTTLSFNDMGLFVKTMLACFGCYTIFYWVVCHYTSRMYYHLVAQD